MARKEWLAKGVDGLSFGDRLGDLIANKGITQAELAKSTGICQSRLSDYIAGKEVDREKGTRIYAAPDCATVITLAKYFSVSTDYLLGLTNVRTTDLQIRDIADKTGLIEECVQHLADSKNRGFYDIHFVLDTLILDDQHVNASKNRNYRSIVNLLWFFLEYDGSGNRKIINTHGLVSDANRNAIYTDTIELDDVIIENATLSEVQQALLNIKKAIKQVRNTD